MAQGIKIKINVSLIPREAIFQGQKGKYVDFVIFENRDGVDQFGNSHSVQLDQSKEARERGDKKIYVGNGKWLGGGQQQKPAPQQQSYRPAQKARQEPVETQEEDGSDIPF